MKSKLFKVLGVVAVVAMLATALVAPVAGLATSGLVVGDTTINISTTYTVTVTLGAQLLTGATITTTFPTGATGLDTATATIASSGGLAFSPYAASVIAVTHTASTQNLVATITAPLQVGVGAIVQLVFTGIGNPATIGTYPVMLMTSAETTAITVGSVTTTVPVVTPLPGTASVYNTAGILMFQSISFKSALDYVTAAALDKTTIKLTAGTYNDAFTTPFIYSVTIQGTDASAATVILKSTAPWLLSGPTVVIDKVTIDGSDAGGGVLTVNASTAGTISNSILKGGVLAMGGLANTLTNDTFTVLTGADGFHGNTAATVTNCTFNVAGTGKGLGIAANSTVSGCTFTGVAATGTTSTGLGAWLVGGTTTTIGTSTFTGLTPAFWVSAGGGTFSGNTVDKCGIATTGPDTIVVSATSGLSVVNNKITNSLGYIINVAANDNLVFVMGNNFSGNAKNAADAANAVGGTPLMITHNYWGGTASNPASVTVAPLISYASPLGAAPTAASISLGAVTASTGTFDASATAGVIVTGSSATTEIGAVLFGANPLTTAIDSAYTAKTYYDVFGVGTGVTATLQFNGSTAKPIASSDAVFMWNAIFGRWDKLTGTGANAYGNYITTGAVNISGTIFCVATQNPFVNPVPPDITPQYPESGATDVPVDVTFTWPAVTGATGYQFAIAQDNPDLASKFAVLDYSANTITNAHKVQETLLPNTTYWWEVRSVAGTVYSAWTIQTFFTTAKAPVVTSTTTTPPITIVQTTVTYTNPPVTTVTYTLPQPKETQPIPSYLLWAVIAVGAVLVIAVIVLIVRTRRMP
jgi:hypothetical protein